MTATTDCGMRTRLGRVLVKAKLLTGAELATLYDAIRSEADFWETILRTTRLTEDQVAEALAAHCGLDVVALAGKEADPRALALVPEDEAAQHVAVPVALRDADVLELAVANPLDGALAAALAARGVKSRLVVATPSAIRAAIAARYQASETLLGKVREVDEGEEILSLEDAVARDGVEAGVLDLSREEARPIIRTVSIMLRDAIERRASDIHVEAVAGGVRVRYRIDGVLEEVLRLSRRTQSFIVARLKVLAEIDIAERRIPQDGRFRMKLGAREVDVRVSTLPTYYGEKVVLRLLDPGATVSRIEDLGFDAAHLAAIRDAGERPQGEILVTGPTGSGKSSTLFAALREIMTRPVNIVTIENPVEYDVSGLNQVQVNEKAGLTFAATLRSILRQDPNVILVGEIRDRETAEIASQAAMTGHLVLSTLHTNDAPAAIARLFDLGVPPYLVASALALVVAQRLVRRVCRACAARCAPAPAALARLGLDPAAEYVRGAGCAQCGGTGYRGRLVVAEVLPVDNHVREMIAKGEGESALRRAMRATGLRSIVEDAAHKVREGLTTAEEVLRVVEISSAGRVCPSCAEALESDYTVCPACCAVVRPICRECRQPLKPAWSVCPYCGAAAARAREGARV
jgi:type IV pilus assembly protein PilB